MPKMTKIMNSSRMTISCDIILHYGGGGGAKAALGERRRGRRGRAVAKGRLKRSRRVEGVRPQVRPFGPGWKKLGGQNEFQLAGS